MFLYFLIIHHFQLFSISSIRFSICYSAGWCFSTFHFMVCLCSICFLFECWLNKYKEKAMINTNIRQKNFLSNEFNPFYLDIKAKDLWPFQYVVACSNISIDEISFIVYSAKNSVFLSF